MTPSRAGRLRRVFIVIQGHCLDLIPRLRTQFPRATIIVDQRRGDERRQQARRVVVERRRGLDRRRPLTEPEEQLWERAGYRILYRTGK